MKIRSEHYWGESLPAGRLQRFYSTQVFDVDFSIKVEI